MVPDGCGGHLGKLSKVNKIQTVSTWSCSKNYFTTNCLNLDFVDQRSITTKSRTKNHQQNENGGADQTN